MTTKHTKGPWTCKTEGSWIGQVFAHNVHHVERYGICKAFGETPEEKVANAKLIASAPDMLDALQAAKDWIQFGGEDVRQSTLNQIQAAIQKSTE